MQDRSHNFYAGKTIFFGTQHQKAKILAPIFEEIGVRVEEVEINTDQFGTFSGEVERRDGVRATLRKKLRASAQHKPEGQLFLASEGSFFPHPMLGFLSSNLESLLFWDRERDFEIYAEHMTSNPSQGERILGPTDDYRSFLQEIDFPNCGVILQPSNRKGLIMKDVTSLAEVEQAMLSCFNQSPEGKVLLSVDLRAHRNPHRREVILQAGRNLLEKLASRCPACGIPGFAILRGVGSLPCSACGTQSRVPSHIEWSCVKCEHMETRPRPDGLTTIEMSECDYCNP